MSAYAPRHAPPARLTPVRLASLDAAVLAVAILAVVLALLAMTRPGTGALSTPQTAVSAPSPVRTTPHPAAPQRPAQAHTAPVRHYAVRTGDSLWSISLRAYGTGRDWGRIYAANRTAIGPDPGHIQPGLRLIIPRQ